MTSNMENYEFGKKSRIENILFIKQLLCEEFPRRVKGRMCRKMVFDELCIKPERIT